jgi:hypothetical protein
MVWSQNKMIVNVDSLVQLNERLCILNELPWKLANRCHSIHDGVVDGKGSHGNILGQDT